jgi:hypothetical protein
MSIIEGLPGLEQEAQTTRRVLERVERSPRLETARQSMSLGQLAQLIA